MGSSKVRIGRVTLPVTQQDATHGLMAASQVLSFPDVQDNMISYEYKQILLSGPIPTRIFCCTYCRESNPGNLWRIES